MWKDTACQGPSDKGKEILLSSEDEKGNRAVDTAAEYRKDEVFEYLVDKTLIKHLNSYGRGLLHVIAEFGSVKCLDIFVNHVRKKVRGESFLKEELKIG